MYNPQIFSGGFWGDRMFVMDLQQKTNFLTEKGRESSIPGLFMPNPFGRKSRGKDSFSDSRDRQCKGPEYLLITKSFPHFPQTFPQPFSTGEFQLFLRMKLT